MIVFVCAGTELHLYTDKQAQIAVLIFCALNPFGERAIFVVRDALQYISNNGEIARSGDALNQVSIFSIFYICRMKNGILSSVLFSICLIFCSQKKDNIDNIKRMCRDIDLKLKTFSKKTKIGNDESTDGGTKN